jgi:hypothetical protein
VPLARQQQPRAPPACGGQATNEAGDEVMWSHVRLGGYHHTIPEVCPNCLAEAHEPVRCFHKGLFSCFYYPLGPAGQTFFYCEGCVEAARAGVRCDRLGRFLAWCPCLFLVTGLFFCVARLIARLIVGLVGPLNVDWEAVPSYTGLVVFFVGTAVSWRLTTAGYRRILRQRHPKTDAQAVWGVAAYYTDSDNYKAARPEWIEALVRCNPGSVKPKVYRRITGEDPPD